MAVRKRKPAKRRTVKTYTGGCLCGAVRFRVRGTPQGVAHCHCSMCRKASGAPIVTFAGFPSEGVRITKGKVKFYRSSSFARRAFCAKCGSQLYFEYDRRPERIGFNVGSFDHPERLKPERHIYVETMIPWLHMKDGLPRQKSE